MKTYFFLAGVLALPLSGCAPGTAQDSNAAAPRDAVITSPAKTGASASSKTQSKSDESTPVAQSVVIELPSGYKEKAATLQAGKPARITFVLKSDAGCGDTVVVPAAKWRKTLKVGERASVVFAPQKSGELKFACGMDMYHGSIVVR